MCVRMLSRECWRVCFLASADTVVVVDAHCVAAHMHMHTHMPHCCAHVTAQVDH
jgi:hypothetical protein